MIAWILSAAVLLLLLRYNWNRRFLYYYAAQIPGSTCLPLLGTVELITKSRGDFYKTLLEIIRSQPPVFKLWTLNELTIVDTEPDDIDFILCNFLKKGTMYKMVNEILTNTILTSPVRIWKAHRKLINHSFCSKMLNSYHDIFVKYSKQAVRDLHHLCYQEVADLLFYMWKCTADTATETLLDIDPLLLGSDRCEILETFTRGEHIIAERFDKVFLFIDFTWKLSSTRCELKARYKRGTYWADKAIAAKKATMSFETNDHKLENKIFLPLLLDASRKNEITETELAEEMKFMFAAASETTAYTVVYAILSLALYPEIQNKIFEELSSVWKISEKDLSLEDMKSMDYLENVIKETLRLFPTIPIITREVEYFPDQYTFPKGSQVLIPIIQLHRRADLWHDPLKFDPDRFLPENMAKIHRCAYIPFGHGARNCIGFRYGLMSVKVMLAYILKQFRIKPLNYSSIEEIESHYHIVMEPKNCRVMFEKRSK